MKSAVLDDVRKDYALLVGFGAVVGQLALLKPLFSTETSSMTIYSICLALFTILLFVGIRHYRRGRYLPAASRQRHVSNLVALTYVLLALVALAPGAYRMRYLYSAHGGERAPRRIGPDVGAVLGRATLYAQQRTADALKLTIMLDYNRTSLSCIRPRPGVSGDAFYVTSCAEYGLSSERAGYLIGGDSTPFRDPAGVLNALKRISAYRGRNEPLFERGPDLLSRFSDPEWRPRLETLLPNTGEWSKLAQEDPKTEQLLRDFVVERVGFPDPFFRVMLTSDSTSPIMIQKIAYTAKARRPKKARLMGQYAVARYELKIKHVGCETNWCAEDLGEPVTVKGESTFDLVIVPEQRRSGIGYDIKLRFVSADGNHAVESPEFTVWFFKDAP